MIDLPRPLFTLVTEILTLAVFRCSKRCRRAFQYLWNRVSECLRLAVGGYRQKALQKHINDVCQRAYKMHRTVCWPFKCMEGGQRSGQSFVFSRERRILHYFREKASGSPHSCILCTRCCTDVSARDCNGENDSR